MILQANAGEDSTLGATGQSAEFRLTGNGSGEQFRPELRQHSRDDTGAGGRAGAKLYGAQAGSPSRPLEARACGDGVILPGGPPRAGAWSRPVNQLPGAA
jgi:hypothetical protein